MIITDNLKSILTKENVAEKWWKVGTNGRGQVLVALDCSVKKGNELAEKFLQYPDIQVEFLTLVAKDDYLEIGISEIT